jgi:NAD(P)-dependent dehydrogenase (short-subunit alcohol dehydrogenase family)/acyl carrier protein
LQISNDSDFEFDAYQLHPAIIDGGLQVLGALVGSESKTNDQPAFYIPTHVDQIRVHNRPGAHLRCRARLLSRGADSTAGEVRLFDENEQPVVDLLGVHFESLGPATRLGLEETVDDSLYELKWQPKERAERPSNKLDSLPAERGSWLIFADSSGVGESLQRLTEAQGHKGILVSRGRVYERVDSSHVRIRADQPEDIRRILESAMVAAQPACRGIVHLWSLDACLSEDATAVAMQASQAFGCLSVLQLVQEMARAQWRTPPPLWIVTKGAQAAGENGLPVDPVQAPVWGLGRGIGQEHSSFWGGLVDLEPGSSRDCAAHKLWEEISNPDGENQLAYREGHRLVARLLRKRPSGQPETPLRWRSDASYLISGGLGDLGLTVARWMVEQGARRLILMGRTKLPPRSSWNSLEAGSHSAAQIAVVRELEHLGASVHLVSADVADEQQLAAFLEQFRAEGWPAIRGVVHAAGVLHDGLLLDLDAAAMNTVLRPKMLGGWLLHRLLREAPLDFFVVFSSAGSLMGQPGQGNYAAANAFLDALAHHRRAQGLPALSINWGPWAELGFAHTEGGKQLTKRLALLGIRSLPPQRALEVLERLIGGTATQIAAIPVNWREYFASYAAGTESSVLSELVNEGAIGALQTVGTGEKRKAILGSDPLERGQLLQTYVREQVARVLGLTASILDIEQPLTNLGLDSLMAVELKNRISLDLGINIPMVRFLQGFSVAQAVTLLLDQLTGETASPSISRLKLEKDDPHQDSPANVDELSDEQVNSMLTDLLTKDAAI